MSLLNGSGAEPSAEELQAMQEEAEKNREERGMAQQLASSGAMEGQAGTHAAPGYWDVIGKPDIGRGEEYEDNLEPFLQTEFASTFALGNISREEYQSWMWAIETEFWTAKNEFHDAESNLGDDDLRVMYGEDRPTLTNEHARRLRSAMQVKKFMASLSVDARGLRSGTEIHAVAKQEGADDGEEDGGRLSGISKWLSG